MKLTPKTFLGKLRRKLGLSDEGPKAILMPTKPGDPGYDTVVVFCGCTRKQLDEHCPNLGMTTEEYLVSVEKMDKELAAMKPEDRRIVEM